MPRLSTENLARICARHPWPVVAVWLAVVLAGAVAAFGVGDITSTEVVLTNDPEHQRAETLLQERLRGPKQAREMVIVASDTATVDDPAFEEFVTSLLTQLRGLPDTVASAASYYEVGDESMVSAARDKTIIPVMLKGEEAKAADNVGPLVDLVKESNRDGFRVMTAGDGSIGLTWGEVSEESIRKAEIIGVPIALVILLFVFGSAVAAGIPLVLAGFTIAIATGAVTIIGHQWELNMLVVNMITMIGLALGIDYSLFIAHRYREERHRGISKHDAIVRAGATSTRAVALSGGTVMAGLLGLFLVPSSVYRSLATGAIAVDIVAVAAAMTLLPALLSLLGDRIEALRLPLVQRRKTGPGEVWNRAARLVMAHPLISVAVTVSALAAATIPYSGINLGVAGVSTLPDGSETRTAFGVLEEDFSVGLISPAEIVVDASDVDSPEIQQSISQLLASLDNDPIFGEATVQTNEAGDLALVSVLIQVDPLDQDAYDAMDRLRGEYIPAAFGDTEAEVLVAGSTAEVVDLFEVLDTYTPIVFIFVLGLSFIMLLLVFRSLVVPVKALIMNLLSVGATYGLLVLVFQHGVGNEIFGFQQTDTIAAWLPLFLFAFIFGLSMDYHVFLLSRIKERFDETGNNTESVAYGIQSTAGIITGAASIMVAVFAVFSLGDLQDLQQAGFGLAMAVAIDATIVRSVLVPSTMALLGDANWYFPRWLEWLPQVHIEGHRPARVRAAEPGK